MGGGLPLVIQVGLIQDVTQRGEGQGLVAVASSTSHQTVPFGEFFQTAFVVPLLLHRRRIVVTQTLGARAKIQPKATHMAHNYTNTPGKWGTWAKVMKRHPEIGHPRSKK